MATTKKAAAPKKAELVVETGDAVMGAKFVKAKTGRLLMLRKAAKKGQ
jgi:hypothetical protein